MNQLLWKLFADFLFETSITKHRSWRRELNIIKNQRWISQNPTKETSLYISMMFFIWNLFDTNRVSWNVRPLYWFERLNSRLRSGDELLDVIAHCPRSLWFSWGFCRHRYTGSLPNPIIEANNSIRESSSPYNQGPKFSFSLILLQNSYLFQISRLYYKPISRFCPFF